MGRWWRVWAVCVPMWAQAALPELEPAQPGDLTVQVPEALSAPAWVMDEAIVDALRAGDWDDATNALLAIDPGKLGGAQQADRAFVLCWAALRANRAAEVLDLLPLVRDGGVAPVSYRSLVVAELLRAKGEALAALTALEAVDADAVIAPRAEALRAELLVALGRTAEGSSVLERMVARPDPAEGSALAWLTLARRRGVGSVSSYEALRHLWAWYPISDEGKEAATLLDERYPERRATREQTARRAERFADAGAWSTALTLLDEAEAMGGKPADPCMEAWIRGRSLYKKNRLGDAIGAFGNWGATCASDSEGPGHKILYTKALAQFRRGEFRSSAATYASIAAKHGDTTYADDGLTRAGIALLEAGDTPAALAMWRDALERFPDGDTVPEAAFRMAFNLYEQGDTAEAIEIADTLGKLDQTADEVHVVAGRYWAARWRLYPDVKAPNVPVGDPAAKSTALKAWEQLAIDTPYNFYAALAWSRLAELAPKVAARLKEPAHMVPQSEAWAVRPVFLDHEAVKRAVGLVRVGLVREALAEWGLVDQDGLRPDEVAWFADLRIQAGDWLRTHAAMHSYLRDHPLGTLGGREPAFIALAYPDRYLAEVQAAAGEASYPPRFFHALVREESSFNRKIVSFAGARGLSQLMPATARGVAKKMGVSLDLADLFDPSVNLPIGARYLDDVLKGQRGNFCLALAGYNAGPARVDGWVRDGGNVPLDEFVERIPYRETRGYVKRVTGTWQTYQYATGRPPAYVDLSAFNHAVRP